MLEITLIHTVDIEDNKYYLNKIMEKVIPKCKTKLFLDVSTPLYKSYSVTIEYQITNSIIEPRILQIVPWSNPLFQFDVLE